MSLRIVEAQPEQAEEVAALIREAFRPQVALLGLRPEANPHNAAFETAEMVRERMARGVVWVGYEGEALAGTVGVQINPEWASQEAPLDQDFGWIQRLAVLPEYRGRSCGGELMAWAEAELAQRGLCLVRLAIVAQFDRLQAFYTRLGYRVVGEKRLPSSPHCYLFMEKRLG